MIKIAIYDISKYKKDKQDHIEDFEKDTGIEVIDHDIDSLGELEDEYDEFQQMTYKQRKVSNAKSEELYGMNNTERYDKKKSELLKDTKYNNTSIKIQAESNIIDMTKEPEVQRFTEEDEQKQKDYEAAIEIAKSWSAKSMISIITPEDTLHQLESSWSKWNEMHLKHRRDSDMKSVELFKMTNKEHYEMMKSEFLKRQQAVSNDHKQIEKSPAISSNDEKISADKDIIESCLEKGDIIIASKVLMELKNLELDGLYESLLINKVEESFKENVNLDVNKYYNKINDLPFFTPEQLVSMGTYFKDTYYESTADNKYLDNDNTITTKDWFDCYNRTVNGFLNEDFNHYTSLWINKLNTLYRDYETIKESGDINKINSRKQSILELGWNPEIDFNLENRYKASKLTKESLKNTYSKDIYDIREFYNASEEAKYIHEAKEDNNTKFPLFVVLSFSGDPFAKVIVRATKGKFSHSALGLDTDLSKLYSYDLKTNGFSLESLDRYKKKNSSSNVAVMCTFVTKEDLKKVKMNIDYLIANRNETRYSITNILGIGLNKDFEFNTSMICSQFVDRVLKMVNVDYTKKPSGLVTPNDFYVNKSNKMYLIYEGNIMGYNVDKAKTLIKKLQKNANYIQEQSLSILNESQFIESINENSLDNLLALQEHSSVLNEGSRVIYESYIKPYTDIYYYNEAKELPVQFDKEGNLLIKNMKRLDFDSEYAKSHKLLLVYEEHDNLEGMKYELSKLWFMNTLIEEKIYNNKISEEEKKKLYKARARILNDFKKYLKVVSSKESFNFTEYYNNTPFSDATIKISKHTIKYGVDVIKLIAGKLV